MRLRRRGLAVAVVEGGGKGGELLRLLLLLPLRRRRGLLRGQQLRVAAEEQPVHQLVEARLPALGDLRDCYWFDSGGGGGRRKGKGKEKRVS